MIFRLPRWILVSSIVLLFVGTEFIPGISGIEKNASCLTEQTNSSINDNGILDLQYIYNLTENLSNIIYTEYNESAGEIAEGRYFGTKGEHRAAEILFENMTKLGLNPIYEQIKDIKKNLRPDLSKLTYNIDILEYGLKVNNETVTEFHITPATKGPRENPKQLDYNFSYKGLKVYLKPKFLSPWKITHLLKEKEDFVFIELETAFNPDFQLPIIKFLSHFFSPLSKPLLFGPKVLKYEPEITRLYNFFPHCKGIIRYENNTYTYNQGSTGEKIPRININGTVGKKILDDLENASVDFYLNQSVNESVISYNVIGQINGTDPSKTVIVDCLYDSWWTQGTADSAIGMAMVLGIAKYFKDHNIKPRYNIKFIGFGGEEAGVKGAYYYEATHKNENIVYVIDLNQIGFWQNGPRMTLNVICNKLLFLGEIWKIVKKTDYKGITKDTADIKPVWLPTGAPSDDQAFAMYRPGVKTVCFLKDTTWLFHHRDGAGHTEGDSMKYFDWDDVNATGQIVLNVTRHLAVGDV